MPYIKNKLDRELLNNMIIDNQLLLTRAGCLNYVLFKLAKDHCNNYKELRALIGELEMAKLEIYRRLVAPYEDKKIKENGDVD